MTRESIGYLFVDDGGPVADNLWSFAQQDPKVKRLALAGAPDREGATDVVRVKGRKADIKGVVRTLERQQLLTAVVPRSEPDPAVLISDFASAARPLLEQGYPGFAIGFCQTGGPYRKIAAVTDRSEAMTTGILAGFAVSMAAETGARLDVLVLGADQDELGDDPGQLFDVAENAHFLDRIRQIVRENDIDIHWIGLGSSGDRDQLAIDAVRNGGYDAVIDDVREINIGPRFGRLERVRRSLTEGSIDTCYRLLRDAPCDVYVVLDAARMHMFSQQKIIAGAGAAMMLGTIAVGATAARGDSDSYMAMQQAIEAELEPGAADAVEEALAGVEEESSTAGVEVPEPRVIPGVDQLPAEVTQDQLKAGASALSEAQAGLDAENQELAQALAAAETTAAAAAAAEAELAAAQSALENVDSRQQVVDRALERAEDGDSSMTEKQRADLEAERDQLNLQEAALQMRLSAAEQAAPAAQEAAQQAAEVAGAQQAVADQVNNEVQQMNALYAEAEQRVETVLPTENFWISATYGQPGPHWSSGYHTGLDFAAPEGTPLYAIDDGVVIEAGWGGAYGNYTVIQNSDGTTAHYAHQASMGVSVGQQVSAGQQIGTLGNTGNSTGPHLHFEIRDAGGSFMDPAAYLGM